LNEIILVEIGKTKPLSKIPHSKLLYMKSWTQKLNSTPIISISHARFQIVVVFISFSFNAEVQIEQTLLEHNNFLSGTLMTPSTWSITLLLDWSLYPGQPLWACWWQLGLLGLLHQGSFLRLHLKKSGFTLGKVVSLLELFTYSVPGKTNVQGKSNARKRSCHGT